MGNFFAIKEDPNHHVPKEVYGWRIYALCFSAAWASAMYGYDSAFIGGTLSLPSFKAKFGLDTAGTAAQAALSSQIVSTFQGGAFFGVIGGTFLSERYGRKWVIVGSGAIFSIGVILQMIGTIGFLYGGRVLTGLGVGASSTMLPIYISECSPAAIRGRCVGIFEIMLQIALVFGFWVNYGVNQNVSPVGNLQWHIPVAIQFIPASLLMISVPFLIESPRWLVIKGRYDEALKALSWVSNLSQEHPYVQQQLAEIKASVRSEIEATGGQTSVKKTIKEMGTKGVRNRIVIGVLLMLLQNLTGINAINYYSPTIFKSIGFTGTSTGLLATGVYGLIKMLTTVVFMVFIVDRFGRRSALLVGAAGAACAMLYLGIYSTISHSFTQTPPADAGARLAVVMIYLYAIFYGFSWNGIPWIFAAEAIPTRVRTFGMMCCVCMQWLAQFMVVYSLPYMVASIKSGIFFFFFACTVCAGCFAFLFVPETKGISLEDMDLLFGRDVPIFARAAQKNYLSAQSQGRTGPGRLHKEEEAVESVTTEHFDKV